MNTPHDIMLDFSEKAANSAVDHFEEWLFTELAEWMMEHRISGEATQAMLTIAYEAYRQGCRDGTDCAMEAWRMARRRMTTDKEN